MEQECQEIPGGIQVNGLNMQMNYFSRVAQINSITRDQFEQTCLRNTDHVYVGDRTVLCKVLANHKMYVDATDLGIAPHLIMDGYWESWLTQLLARIVQPGFTCLDIGANFGYFSILLSELAGEMGKTFAIEPNPAIAKLLRSTRSVNGCKFEIIETALAEKKGEAVLTINDGELGGGTIKSNEAGQGRSQVKVATISVDELVFEKSIGKVDVIKMDVEGVEPLVFQGMRQTIKDNPGIQIIIEYSPSIYENAREFTEYLFSNFIVFRVKDVDVLTELKRSDISKLLAIKDHTDLYLRK